MWAFAHQRLNERFGSSPSSGSSVAADEMELPDTDYDVWVSTLIALFERIIDSDKTTNEEVLLAALYQYWFCENAHLFVDKPVAAVQVNHGIVATLVCRACELMADSNRRMRMQDRPFVADLHTFARHALQQPPPAPANTEYLGPALRKHGAVPDP